MFNKPSSIEKKLTEARRRLKNASLALTPKHKGGEWEAYYSANREVLTLEREFAKSKNEMYAIPCDFPVKWDIGAPLPFLLCNDYRTFLTFYVSEPDPVWDGTYVTVIDPSSQEEASLCLVTFNNCVSAKLGHPNDEVLSGHALYGRGLEGYTAQIVINSPWIKEVAKNNSVHRGDDPQGWNSLYHYVFWFHDSTFECLAKSYEVELSREPLSQLLNRVQEKLIK